VVGAVVVGGGPVGAVLVVGGGGGHRRRARLPLPSCASLRVGEGRWEKFPAAALLNFFSPCGFPSRKFFR
jgi:hypothetical protein